MRHSTEIICNNKRKSSLYMLFLSGVYTVKSKFILFPLIGKTRKENRRETHQNANRGTPAQWFKGAFCFLLGSLLVSQIF